MHPAKIKAIAQFSKTGLCFFMESHNQYPKPTIATKRKSVKNSFAESSLIKGIISLNFVPMAIPLFSTKRSLKKAPINYRGNTIA